jgi:DNA-binding MarR family transcriptional regulator
MQPIADRAEDPALTSTLVPDLFRIARRLRSAGGPVALDIAAVLILHRLATVGPTRPTELAADVTLDLSTVSRHVRSLQDAGLVTRHDDPHDGRSCLVSLTDSGDAVLVEALRRRQQHLATALSTWDPDDVADLHRLLGRLADDLEDGQEPTP